MKVVCIVLLTLAVSCYLELELVRVPHSSKKTQGFDNEACPPEPINKQFTEVCYMKDIAHCIELFHNDRLMLMSMDFTIPISWVKGPRCRITNTSHPCDELQTTVREQIVNKIKTAKNRIQQRFKKDNQTEVGETVSIGSYDKIEGILQKGTNVEFVTKDSDKMTSLYKLFLIGLFLTGQKDKILLNSSNFVNATQLCNHTSKLQDGAISLRFDDESENSFLNEMFTYMNTTEKIITVYLGMNSTVTIGDLSVKNAERGYAGLEWVSLSSGSRYPLIDQVTIEDQGTEKVKSFEANSEAILTLSASYIGLPQKIITSLIKNLQDVAKCKVATNKFLECQVISSKKWAQKSIVFEVGDLKLSFSTSQLEKNSRGTRELHIRQSETNFTIFGQPIFLKYFVALDYQKNKIGFADRRITFQERLFQLVTLVRILTFIFVSGFLFIVCHKPVMNMVDTIKLYYKINDYSKGSDSTKLRYAGIEDHGYDDLNRRVRQSIDSPVQGI